MSKPRYRHNCEYCVFLGRFKMYDLYVEDDCKRVYARHGSNPQAIIPSSGRNFIGLSLQAQAIRAAYHKAQLAGYDISAPNEVKNHPDLFPKLSNGGIVALVRNIQHGYDFMMTNIIEQIMALVECTEEFACQFAQEVHDGLTDPLDFKERLIQIRYATLDSEYDEVPEFGEFGVARSNIKRIDFEAEWEQSQNKLIAKLEGTIQFWKQECTDLTVKLDDQSRVVSKQSEELIELKETIKAMFVTYWRLKMEFRLSEEIAAVSRD